MLDNSAKWFAARKTALQVLQLIALTKDEERGTKRPFREFKKLAKGVLDNYNKTWLKTEYDTAIAAARSAKDWQVFEAEADLYPNLEYMRTVSAIPREEHLTYVGIIRPINDPFWNTHFPPLAFNCKCSTRNTNAEVTEIPPDIDETDPVAPALQNNPGKTGMLFNLPATTYYKETEYLPDELIENELKTRVLPEMKFYIKAYEFSNGGSLEIHPAIDKSEFSYNTILGGKLASKGHKIQLQGLSYFPGAKNPDAIINNIKADFKAVKTANNIKGIKNAFASTSKQGAGHLVLDFREKEVQLSELIRGLRGSILEKGKPINKSIKKVTLFLKNKKVIDFERTDIEDNSFIESLQTQMSNL